MGASGPGRLHAAARVVGIAANATIFTALFLMFGTGTGGFSDHTRRVIQGSLLAGFVCSAVGVVLLVILSRRDPKPGWGLLGLILFPTLVCLLLILMMVA